MHVSHAEYDQSRCRSLTISPNLVWVGREAVGDLLPCNPHGLPTRQWHVAGHVVDPQASHWSDVVRKVTGKFQDHTSAFDVCYSSAVGAKEYILMGAYEENIFANIEVALQDVYSNDSRVRIKECDVNDGHS